MSLSLPRIRPLAFPCGGAGTEGGHGASRARWRPRLQIRNDSFCDDDSLTRVVVVGGGDEVEVMVVRMRWWWCW